MAFIRVLSKDCHKDEVCINGRFVYAIKYKPLKAGRAKTDAYVDNRRRLESRFCAKCFHEEIDANDASPKNAVTEFKRLSISHIILQMELPGSGCFTSVLKAQSDRARNLRIVTPICGKEPRQDSRAIKTPVWLGDGVSGIVWRSGKSPKRFTGGSGITR